MGGVQEARTTKRDRKRNYMKKKVSGGRKKQSIWKSCQLKKKRKKLPFLKSSYWGGKKLFSSRLLYSELLKECLTLITVASSTPLMKPKWFKCPLSAQLSQGGGRVGARGQLLQTAGVFGVIEKQLCDKKKHKPGKDRWGQDDVCSFTNTRRVRVKFKWLHLWQ